MSPRFILTGLIAATFVLSARSAWAGSFTISNASTTAQTLGTGSGQTGSITASGSLTASGGAVAVTISGNSATLTNLGTISQTGTGRAIRDNTGVTGLVVTNGSATNSTALMQTADADVIQMNKSPASVTLNNYGRMISLNASAGGAQAVDFNAIVSGSNTINNYSTGIMQAAEADAVRPGVNGVVSNAGLMKSTTSTGSSSDGVDAQSNSGIQITNDVSATIEGGRHGVTGGNTATDASGNPTVANGAYSMTVTNNGSGIIQGDNGSGINIDGLNGNESVTVINHGTITGNGHSLGDGNAHDGDGVDIDGLVNVTNTGTIKSINAYGGAPVNGVQGIEFSEGVTVGGGTIINSGLIQGSVAAGNSTAVGRGITIAGVDKLLTTVGGAVTETAIPVQAPYGAATITNQTGGRIIGDSDSAILFSSALAGGFGNTITNQVGALIQTGSATAPAILTGADNDTITNAGTIDGASSGKAIDLGAGDDNLNITGGAASISGDVSGGAGTNKLTLALGAGQSFSYAGSISAFSTVEVQSGTTTLSGASTYTGLTKLTGGSLTLSGANRLAAAGALELDGGNLKITASGPNGQTFATLSLGPTGGTPATSTIDLGSTTSLTFNALGSFTAGDHLTVIGYDELTAPGYALRFAGDLTGNGTFLDFLTATTIDGGAAVARFDGAYTDLAPVPEPGTVGFGIAVLLGACGRRRRSRVNPAA